MRHGRKDEARLQEEEAGGRGSGRRSAAGREEGAQMQEEGEVPRRKLGR